ncbi:MAG: ATP-binding cassette domain-containing protein [Pseudomonadota bacterium]
MTTAVIDVKNITKQFDNILALHDVSFFAHSREVHALLGDNGAGKSTLIKTLAGMWKPTSGTIALDGVRVDFNSPREAANAGIGTVFQDLALVPLMSVTRNFWLGRELFKGFGPFSDLRTQEMEKIARAEMLKLGIDVVDMDQPVGTMSGGQRQTLAIARAVYFGAKVLILDEPTSALGQKQQLEVLRMVDKVRQQADVAIILITHNDLHAKLIADRFTFLSLGRVLASGTKEELDGNEIRRLMAGGAELADIEREFSATA